MNRPSRPTADILLVNTVEEGTSGKGNMGRGPLLY